MSSYFFYHRVLDAVFYFPAIDNSAERCYNKSV